MSRDRDRMCDDGDAAARHIKKVQAQFLNRTSKRLDEIAAAEIKKQRMKTWKWRREHLSGPHMHADHKSLRLVARRAAAPLFMVEAMVRRLDDFAAGNEPRGSLEGFSIPELAAHWNVANDDVLARIYAALESPEIAWIDGDFIVDFWARNPDTPDNTSRERQDRSRKFRDALDALAELRRIGRIGDAERDQLETAVLALRERSRRGGVPHWRDELRAIVELSTGSSMSQRDSVTVTTRAEQSVNQSSVENSFAAASVAVPGLGKDQEATASLRSIDAEGVAQAQRQPVDATAWLAGDGRRLLIERTGEHPGRVDTLRERWLRDVESDAPALMAIVKAVLERGRTGVVLLLAIGEEVLTHRDRQRRAIEGAELPLKSVLQGGRTDHPQSERSQRDSGSVDNARGESPPDLKKAVGES